MSAVNVFEEPADMPEPVSIERLNVYRLMKMIEAGVKEDLKACLFEFEPQARKAAPPRHVPQHQQYRPSKHVRARLPQKW